MSFKFTVDENIKPWIYTWKSYKRLSMMDPRICTKEYNYDVYDLDELGNKIIESEGSRNLYDENQYSSEAKPFDIIKLVDMEQIVDHSHKNLNPKYYNSRHGTFKKNNKTMLNAIDLAFNKHTSLVLKPVHFLITILQGLSIHINKHAEELRHVFVDHEGQQVLEVERDSFVLGGENEWSSVFEELATLVKQNMHVNLYDISIDNFESIIPATQIVSQLTLMNSMQKYFTYICSTKCGITEITLDGPPEDWLLLKEKVHSLSELNIDDQLQLNWWFDFLIPLIDKVCDTAITAEINKMGQFIMIGRVPYIC